MFDVNVNPKEVNQYDVAWYTVITSKSVSGKTVFDFQSVQAPYIIRESNRFTPSMVLCTNKTTGETSANNCKVQSNWQSKEMIGYKTTNKKFYYVPNYQSAVDNKVIDITTKVQQLNFVAPPYFLLNMKPETQEEGNGENDIEGEGIRPQDQPAEYDTSGKIKPLGKDESGLIESPLALLIPDFLKINSDWFDGKNPEASKKFNRFLLILLAVGVLSYGRKKRVSRRTARRTTKRVIRRKQPAI